MHEGAHGHVGIDIDQLAIRRLAEAGEDGGLTGPGRRADQVEMDPARLTDPAQTGLVDDPGLEHAARDSRRAAPGIADRIDDGS